MEQLEEQNLGYFQVLKRAYTKKSTALIIVNILCLYIVFFTLDESIGSFGIKLFAFIFCIVVGGAFGIIWSVKRHGGKVKWFKYGSGILLVFFTFIAWSNNGFSFGLPANCEDDISSYNDGYTHGKIISHAYDASSTSCSEYIQMMSNQGLSIGSNDCWCSGFNDGKLKRENKYK